MSFAPSVPALLAGLSITLGVTPVASKPLAAQPPGSPAPRVTTTLPAPELAALEGERRAVWVNWFSGDTTALRRALGPELVAMSNGSDRWQSLDESIAGSARFKAEGGTLVSVDFDGTTIHRFGETVVMFSRYRVVTAKQGTRTTMRGRATEVFVRAGTRWVHTSWHLDESAGAP